MKKKSLKVFAVCFMTVSMMSTAVLPALANEPAEEPATEVADQTPALPEGELSEKNCGCQVSKYDLVPGQYYVMTRPRKKGMNPELRDVFSTGKNYQLIRVENVYEDYTVLFKLWSFRKANIFNCTFGCNQNIECDNYEFYEPVV